MPNAYTSLLPKRRQLLYTVCGNRHYFILMHHVHFCVRAQTLASLRTRGSAGQLYTPNNFRVLQRYTMAFLKLDIISFILSANIWASLTRLLFLARVYSNEQNRQRSWLSGSLYFGGHLFWKRNSLGLQHRYFKLTGYFHKIFYVQFIWSVQLKSNKIFSPKLDHGF